MQQNKRRLPKVLLLTLKITLAILLVWWLWHSGKLDGSVIVNVRPSWALAGVLVFQTLMILMLCWRWHLLLKVAGTSLPFRSTFIINLMAQCTSTFTPGSIGVDGTRFYHLYKLFPNQRAAAWVSIIWDRLIGIGALLFVTIITNSILLFTPLPAPFKSTFTLILVCSIVLLAVPLSLLFPHNPLRKIRRWKMLQKLPLPSSNKSAFMLPATLACCTHFCNAMGILCAFYALGFHVPLGQGLLLLPLIILTGTLPLTPLGIGVTDAVALLVFSTIHISSGANAIMLGRIIFVSLSALCGIAWFVPIVKNMNCLAKNET